MIMDHFDFGSSGASRSGQISHCIWVTWVKYLGHLCKLKIWVSNGILMLSFVTVYLPKTSVKDFFASKFCSWIKVFWEHAACAKQRQQWKYISSNRFNWKEENNNLSIRQKLTSLLVPPGRWRRNFLKKDCNYCHTGCSKSNTWKILKSVENQTIC